MTDGAVQHQSVEPAALRALACELAVGAAQVVRDGRAAGLKVNVKSTATDLVTDVDRDTERWLVERLRQLRPGDAVLGEEGGASREPAGGAGGVRWLLDPIDGTVNFVLDIPQYGVSVAAEVDGVVVAGAVCNPATGELFHAHLHGGAALRDGPGAEDRVLTGPRAVPLHRAVVGTGFGYDAGRRALQAATVAALLPQVADIRRIGAAALDLCFLAAGRLDGYFEAGLNPWDYAAGALIAREAGCEVSGLRGRPASGAMVAAGGPSSANELFAALEALDADRVAPSGR